VVVDLSDILQVVDLSTDDEPTADPKEDQRTL